MIATYISPNSFSVAKDRTLEFVVGRRVKCDCKTDGIKYANVISSSYSTVTTVVIDENALTSNLSKVLYGIVEPGPNGSLPIHNHSSVEGMGGDDISFLYLEDTPTTYSGTNGAILVSTSSGVEFTHVGRWYVGNGTPLSGIGEYGSFYLDASNNTIYKYTQSTAASGSLSPIDQTVLLLHMNGADGETLFYDSGTGPSCPHTITNSAGVTTEIEQKKFGSTSAYYSTVSTKRLYTAVSSSDFNFGTNKFTIDFFVKFSTGAGNQYLFDIGSNGFGMRMTSNVLVVFLTSTPIMSYSWTPDSQWHHIAIESDGANHQYLYIDGVRVVSLTSPYNYGSTAVLSIGNYGGGSSAFSLDNGYIDEFRVIKGLQIGNGTTFPVPTAEYNDLFYIPAISGWKLVSILDNAMWYVDTELPPGDVGRDKDFFYNKGTSDVYIKEGSVEPFDQYLLNISPLGTATADSIYNDNVTYAPSKASDSNLTSRWVSKNTAPHWWQIDFDTEYYVDRIAFIAGLVSNAEYFTEYYLEYWRNNTWNQVAHVTGYADQSPTRTYHNIKANTDKIRIRTVAPLSACHAIYEFFVYGGPALSESAWVKIGNVHGNSFLDMPDTPTTFSGTNGSYLITTESGIEFTQNGRWFIGGDDPSTSFGNIDNVFLDYLTNNIYLKKLSVLGSPVWDLIGSTDAPHWFFGSGIPDSIPGAISGDLYFNEDNGDVYKKVEPTGTVVLYDSFIGTSLDIYKWGTTSYPNASVTVSNQLNLNNFTGGAYSGSHCFSLASFPKTGKYRFNLLWYAGIRDHYAAGHGPGIKFCDPASTRDASYGTRNERFFVVYLCQDGGFTSERTALRIADSGASGGITGSVRNTLNIVIDENIWHDLTIDIDCSTRVVSVDLDDTYNFNATINQTNWDSIRDYFVIEFTTAEYEKNNTESFKSVSLIVPSEGSWTKVSNLLSSISFLSLSDTPDIYSDGRYLKSTSSGTEWATVDVSANLIDLNDCPSTYDYGKVLTSTTSGTVWSDVSVTTISGTVLYGTDEPPDPSGYVDGTLFFKYVI